MIQLMERDKVFRKFRSCSVIPDNLLRWLLLIINFATRCYVQVDHQKLFIVSLDRMT